MESATKSKSFSKKRKRKQQTHAKKNSFAKPELFDGMSNWLNLQKVLPPEPKKVPDNSVFKGKPYSRPKKHFKPNKKTNLNSNGPEEKNQPETSFAEKKLSPSSMEDSSENISSSDGIVRLTKTVAMDCEMVGTGPEGKDSIIARVSIVNSYSECIYDEHVKPKEKVTDYRTEISGVRPADLKKGKDLYEVQQDVLSIIEGRRVVGHDLKHDFDVLFINHPKSLIRDTAKYKPFREVSGGRTPSLKKLASVLLGCDIQGAEHSSVEDAQAAMLLYLRHKKAWENSVKPRRKR